MSQHSGRCILLTGDGGPGTLAAVRGLHMRGYVVWLAVSQSATPAARSRKVAGVLNVTDPGADAEQYVQEVAEAAIRVGARAILPGTEGSLRAITGRERLFGEDVAVGTCPPEVLQRATDKTLLTELVREAGLDAPPSFVLSRRQIDTEQLPFPAVVKPVRTADDAGRGVHIAEVEAVSSAADLRDLLAKRPAEHRLLLQPYIDGTLAAICGVAWQGELVCAVHQRSLRIWPLDRGYSSYAMTTPRDPKRAAGVAALLHSLRWSGIFGVQFLLSGGRAYAIDFNARVYGSMALAIAAGLNLPTIWADLLLERPVTIGEYRSGVRYRFEEHDCRALFGIFRRGDRAEALRGLVPRPRTVHAIFAADDPAPTLASIEKVRRGLARRRAEGRLTARSVLETIAVGAARRAEPLARRMLDVSYVRRVLHRRALRAWRSTEAPLILCLGNINRSAFAAELARREHAKSPVSGGFFPRSDRSTPQATMIRAREYGVDLSTHRSNAVDARDLECAPSIFVFDLMNVAVIACRRFGALRRTHLLGTLSAHGPTLIADPQGQPPEVVNDVLHAISDAIQASGSCA